MSGELDEQDPRPDPDAVTTPRGLLDAMRGYYNQARLTAPRTHASRSRFLSIEWAVYAAANGGELPSLVLMRDMLTVCKAEPEYAGRFLTAWRRAGGEAQE